MVSQMVRLIIHLKAEVPSSQLVNHVMGGGVCGMGRGTIAVWQSWMLHCSVGKHHIYRGIAIL